MLNYTRGLTNIFPYAILRGMKRIILISAIIVLGLTVSVTALNVQPPHQPTLISVGVAHPTQQLHVQQASLFSHSSPESTEILQ
jgi:hypothetical protein